MASARSVHEYARGEGTRRPTQARHLPRSLGRAGHELNPALIFLKPGQTVEVSPGDAERLGLTPWRPGAGRVERGSRVEARVAIRGRVAEGACFLIEGTAEGNANVLLNGGGRGGLDREGGRVSLPLADTGVAEATWILIVKSIVIFAVIFAILPVLTVVERS